MKIVNLLMPLLIQSVMSSDIVTLNGNCKTQKLTVGPYEATCQARDNVECITAELNLPFCKDVCAKSMKFKLKLNSIKPPGNCCRKCTCYGDPHCESFNGKRDSWISCDARVKLPRKDWCIMNKDVCLKQKDYYGNSCVWSPKTKSEEKKWSVGLKGSPCISSGPNPPLLMYKADNFELIAYLAERGIIVYIDLTLGGNSYKISADDCLNPKFNWNIPEDVAQVSKEPVKRDSVPKNDYRYTIIDKSTGIQVLIRCTNNYENKKYSLSRFNVENILEPEDPESREGVDGFCYTDKIDKGLSFDVERTDKLLKNSVCNDNRLSVAESMARQICDVTTSVNNCVKSWCSKTDSTDDCIKSVNDNGWPNAWCAFNVNGDVNNDCKGKCLECLHEMNDFGFVAASSAWVQYFQTGESKCLSSLPTTLETCQNGIEIQYFDDSKNDWNTYLVVPEGARICDDLVFNSDDHPELFFNKIRLQQCPKKCKVNKCDYIQGFKATLQFKQSPGICPDNLPF